MSIFNNKTAVFFLLLSIGLAVYAFQNNQLNANSSLAQRQATISPLLDPELNQYPSKDMIVNIEPLHENLDEIVKRYEAVANISLYLEILNTGANISINREMRMWPLSLTKVPLAMAICKKVENHEIEPDDTLELSEEDRNGDSGKLYMEPIGTRLSVSKLMEIMLKDSDNTAYNMLKTKVTDQDLQAVLNSVGLGEIFKTDGTVSAQEYNRLLRPLYSSVYLSRKHSARLLSHLSNTSFHEFLSQGIPEDVTFAHKWGGGYREKLYADAGIVYLNNRPFMLTVLIQGKDDLNTEGSARLSKQIFKEVAEESVKYVRDFRSQN